MKKLLPIISAILISSCCPSMMQSDISVELLSPAEVIKDTTSLELGLIMDKTVFKQGEPIYCYIYVKNISDNYLNVNTRFVSDEIINTETPDIYFEITPEINDKIKIVSDPPRYIREGNFGHLAPLERYYNSYSYDLTQMYASPLKAGNYKVKAKYKNYYQLFFNDEPFDVGGPVWLGEVESPEVEFRVE